MATMDKKLSLGWPSGGHAADNDRFTGHKPAPLTTPVDEYTMRRLHPTAGPRRSSKTVPMYGWETMDF